MDIPECPVPTVLPPSYSEACQCLAYDAQNPSPSTPPPTYTEAVGAPNVFDLSPYPVLNIPAEPRMPNQIQQEFIQQAVQPERPLVVVAPQQVSQGPLRDVPTLTICPHCQQFITTIVEYKPGTAAWAMCFLLALLGFVCGICLIPFCVRSLQDAHHTCPRCNRHIGIYIRK